jgi:hypothetical protein
MTNAVRPTTEEWATFARDFFMAHLRLEGAFRSQSSRDLAALAIETQRLFQVGEDMARREEAANEALRQGVG